MRFVKIQHVMVLFFIASKIIAQDLTIPPKKYVDSIELKNSIERVNSAYPLSDQQNSKSWKLIKKYSDEFEGNNLNYSRWYPNNPKWKGRPPTYFHESNVSLKNGELVIKVNQHGAEKLPNEFTHSTGFIKSKTKFLYGYFEAEAKLMDAPWVSGFWMTNVDKDWWTEIDICENAPGVENNRHDLNSNIHVFKSPKEHGDVKNHFSRTKKYFSQKNYKKIITFGG